jgi:hypothetical protein
VCVCVCVCMCVCVCVCVCVFVCLSACFSLFISYSWRQIHPDYAEELFSIVSPHFQWLSDLQNKLVYRTSRATRDESYERSCLIHFIQSIIAVFIFELGISTTIIVYIEIVSLLRDFSIFYHTTVRTNVLLHFPPGSSKYTIFFCYLMSLTVTWISLVHWGCRRHCVMK